MALPQAAEARVFYQSARQRWIDAEILLREGRNTGATYLAGYGVECMLKALILSAVASGERRDVVATFHGARAHDYAWLKAKYLRNGGFPFPASLSKHFTLAESWTTALRYEPAASELRDAQDFLKAAKAIMDWVDGRL